MKVDLGKRLQFPQDIHTTLRPDVVLWSEKAQKIIIIERTVTWGAGCNEAHEQKCDRYKRLLQDCREKRWQVWIFRVEINKPIEYGKTPLIFACEVGIDRRILEILLEAGGEVRTKDEWGNTALHYAVSSRRLQAVELLLSRGSEINGKRYDGRTPLHLAANLSPEWTDGVKELMKHRALE
ncbi:ankyrin repeat domain-containing protein 1-like, partial [Octopus sinensis]|uniref:Ankyrin repeat domain-containing protein 1-like n=1 Tax=Octopus sinensis TaxID=2607531 RepID=A0A7E6EMJ8_9MOLL